MKQVLMTGAKLALVGALIFWLVHSGRLEFQQLKIFIDHPDVLLFAVLLWLLGSLVLGGYRWFILMRALDVEVSFWRVLHFQLIGFFFNTAVPGAVGGDIIKAVYVIREQQSQRKTRTLLTVLLDRIVGLASLFVMAGTAVLLNLQFFLDHQNMKPLAAFVAIGLIGILIGLVIVFYPHPDGKDPVEKLLQRPLPGFGTLAKIYEALRCYRHRPWTLLWALCISCVIQTTALFFALLVTTILTGSPPPLGIFSTIYPVAVMATAIPLAPGGIGVGHVAFEHLFALGGIAEGANVFNVTVIIVLALNLLGLIPYLLHRSRLPLDSIEKELQAVAEPVR